ncbi:MAG: hypothetical protein M3154_02395 [Candidatus Eremiobacteraeota bacterium]|nr:hypothetical protein [Candidatus Eremiobacteraeota bacterium]
MINRVIIAAVAAVCVLFVSEAPRSANADDSATLIAKHKTYVGWAMGDGALKSSRATVEAAVESPAPTPEPGATPDPLGEAHAKIVSLRRDLLYRASTTAYGIEVRSAGFTGSVFWRANVNGYTVTRRGRDAREGLTEDVIDAEGFGEVPISARPDATFDKKTAAVVRIDPKTGVPADLSFDRDTGALLGYTLQPDVALERQTVHVTVKPKQGAHAFPLDLSAFHAGVPVKIKDTILPRVWVDTGNDFFVILPHELERHTVALSSTASVGGYDYDVTQYFGGVDGGSAVPARCVHLNEVQIGPYRYQKALSCFAPNDAFGVDGGLIGFDFLRPFNRTFDYPHGRLVLTPNGN